MGLIWLGGAWLAGLALGYGRDPRPWWSLICWVALALSSAAVLAPRFRRPLLWSTLALVALTLATWRTTLLPAPVTTLPSDPIEALRGQVVEWPTRGDRSDAVIVAVAEIRVAGAWRVADAQIRADLPLAPRVGNGDQVELYGYYRATGEIDLPGFRGWLERRGLEGQFRAFTTRIVATGERGDIGARRFAALVDVEERLRRHIPGAEGALVTGVFLGDDHLLPKATRDAFEATSTSHTMALSGWNITVIAGLCALIGGWLRQSRSIPWLLGSALAIGAFVVFVGASPTLLRAAIMGTLYLVAEALGRRGDALTALALSAVAMTVLAPATILDIGFQLSCAATAGLILLAPGLTGFLHRRRLPKLLAAMVATTLAAEVATFPLILHHFGRLSRLTLPANLLIEPLVPVIMGGAFVTSIASYTIGPLAELLGVATWLPARLMLFVVETLGALPWATQRFPAPDWPLTLVLYAFLVLILGGSRHLLPLYHRAVALRPTLTRDHFVPLAVGLCLGFSLGAWLLVLR